MFRRARAHREFREAQHAGHALLHTAQAHPGFQLPAPAADQAPTPDPTETVVPDFLPPDLRVPSRQEVEGLMMRWQTPLVIDGEVRACPECGAYRDWIIFNMSDDTIQLRCQAGHTTPEHRLDPVWFNRNSGPVDHFHPTLEEGLRHLGH